MNYLIDFENMEWISPAIGIRYKKYINGNQQVRLIEFSEGFVEPDWCMEGHVGYVLEGEFSNDYNGITERYKKGDVMFIPQGEKSKHKAILRKGERVLLLVFEVL